MGKEKKGLRRPWKKVKEKGEEKEGRGKEKGMR